MTGCEGDSRQPVRDFPMSSTVRANPPASSPRPTRVSRAPELAGEPFPLARRQRARLPYPREMHERTMVGLIALLTVLGAAIELYITRGLSVDEILAGGRAERSLGGVTAGLAHGVQPPLQPLLEWVMVHILGGSDFALRVPSLVAGVALIPSIAALGRELFDRRTAVVAAMFAVVAPVLVWYGQEASPYALVALFGTLAVLGAVRARRRGEPRDWVLHTVAAALSVWSSWSGAFIVAASELILLERVVGPDEVGVPVRRFLVGWGLDSLGLVCQFVPLAILFSEQLSSARGLPGVATVGAAGVSFYTAVSNVSWGLFGFHPAVVTDLLSAVWPLGMLASLLMIGRQLSRRSWLLLLCALVPAIGTLALGLWVPGAFDVRYAVAGVPAAIVLLASIATFGVPGRLGKVLVTGGVLALFAAALIDQQLDPNNPRRYDYRPALAQVQRDAGPGAAIFYEPAELQAVLARDANGLRTRALSTRLPTRAQARSILLITSFTGRPSVRALLNRELGALRATRRLVSYHSYPGVEVWWFR